MLVPEYPGYGIYKRTIAGDAIATSAEQICEDALTVWKYFTSEREADNCHAVDKASFLFGSNGAAAPRPKSSRYELAPEGPLFQVEDVLLLGRSIGACQVLELAAYSCKVLGRKPRAVVLMSAFSSLKSVVTDMLGSLAAFMVRERFQNEELIRSVTCPTLLIHGRQDTLVPLSHSQKLFKNAGGPCSFLQSKRMSHDSFDVVEDLSQPIFFFLAKVTRKHRAASHAYSAPVLLSNELYAVPAEYVTSAAVAEGQSP